MIFYSSGTVNSAAVVQTAAKELEDEAVNIIGKYAGDSDLSDEEYWGFVFPVYAWAASEVTLQFAKAIPRTDAYTFAIATFSNMAGMALEQFSEVVPLKGGFGIVMPDNYPITDHIIDTKECAMEKLKKADAFIKEATAIEPSHMMCRIYGTRQG